MWSKTILYRLYLKAKPFYDTKGENVLEATQIVTMLITRTQSYKTYIKFSVILQSLTSAIFPNINTFSYFKQSSSLKSHFFL
jgi:hypothetical protein